MSIYQTAVKKPVTTALIFVAVAVFGIFSLINIPINLYPEFDANTIMVITTYSGASASDIENNVTKPLENTLNGVSNLKHITSNSKENSSVITLTFEYGIDIDVATNDVRDKLELVKSTLPDDANTPMIFKFGADDMPILLISATAEESMPGLNKILDDGVSNQIARIGGVGTVSIIGAPEREIQVYCDPHKLQAYNISIETIAAIIGQENKNTPGGTVDIGSNTYSVRVQKEFTNANEMLNLVVATRNGKAIYLKDVATVNDGLQERYQEVFTNLQPGAMIMVQKQAGANSVQISKKVKAKLPDIQKDLPSDVHLDVIVDTSDNIINTINSLKETIIITFLVVMLVVYLFLGRWRATFIIIMTIPISLLASLVYLFATGNTLNIISLSSLSIAIGMVVDDAIVVLENVTTHIERGSRPKEAAVYATNEVAISVVASTLTMLAVFFPMTMISGMSGILFRQLGWIVSIIMIVSTIGALSFIPMLCSQLLRLNPHQGKIHKAIFNPINKGLGWLDVNYAKLLNWAVRHRKSVVAIALGLFFFAIYVLAPMMKVEFFPTMDNSRISIKINLPTSTRQDVTRDLAIKIATSFKEKYPEIDKINFSEGAADADNAFAAFNDNGTHIISFNIRLISPTERDRSMTDICDEMRSDLLKYPIIRTFNVIAGGQQGGISGEATADVELYGYDFETTDRVAQEIKAKMYEIEGVKQVKISRDEYIPEYAVDFDREKLAVNGLNVQTASLYVRNRINGALASYYREDGDEYDIRVRLDPKFRQTIEDIENIVIYNAAGKGIYVRDLGKVREMQTPPTIERKDRERVITISAVVPKGMAASDLINAVSEKMEEVDMPAGLSWIFGGTMDDQNDTYSELITLLVLIVILVFIVMAAQFESLTYPFVIMFSIPFAIIGVLLGLVINGTPMSVMAMVGLIMLMGIVVKNGIVLIDYTILCRERGMGVLHSVVTAGKSRLRPVLMTTLTTVLGMIPMAVGRGEGSEMWRGLGMTVAWGLSVSTLITLVLIPTLYAAFAGRGIKRARKASNKKARAAALAE